MRGRATAGSVFDPTDDAAWIIAEEGSDSLRESSVQSRFAISNGFLGVRGALAVNRDGRWAIPPCTYVAGLFDTADAERAVPELVPAADWLQIGVKLPDHSRSHGHVRISSYRLVLDMKRGALLIECRIAIGPAVVMHLRTLRLVSLSERALGLQLLRFDVERGEVDVAIEATFGGLGLGLVQERLERNVGSWRTKRSGRGLAIAAAASLEIDGDGLPPATEGDFAWSWTFGTRPGRSGYFERVVAFARQDDTGTDAAQAARSSLETARALGASDLVAAHERAWALRWRSSDVEVDGDASAQRALRFALYHLNGAANPTDERVSIGARALTGDDYRGHVFWDTEIFLVPFYVFTWPEAARALLMYRFHTLDAARAKAKRLGWKGALYAWESADTGAETTPEQAVGPDRQVIDILCGWQEQHISADVAYAVWQYWQASADDGFLLEAGAEVILETARFWASRAVLEADGRRHIRGVIGPDEYHEGIDDNAFTNVMARWNIRRALDVAEWLRTRWPERWTALSLKIAWDEAELKHCLEVAETIASGLDAETGLYEQFQGFFGLERIDLATYAGRSVPMDVVLGRTRTQRSQVIKQADVVALLGLLPDEFTKDGGEANFRYYQARCSHGSSLSGAMHALVAARLGQSDTALRYFRQSAAIDLADTHVAIAGGVHIATLGGLWQTAVFGFGGLSLRRDIVALDPKLPAVWLSLRFAFQWRGRHVKVTIVQDGGGLEAELEAGDPMELEIGGTRHRLSSAEPLRARFPVWVDPPSAASGI